MPNRKRFLVQGFALNVSDSAYLVEVSPHSEEAEQFQDLRNIPAWIFQSKHAIWLAPLNAPLADRAMEGEQIKLKLIPFFQNRIKPQKSPP